MGAAQGALGRDQARDRVLAALAAKWPHVSIRVREDATLTRTFGWVFTLDVVGVHTTGASTEPIPTPLLALVNKTTAQAVSTSRPYSPERFAALFEGLLARTVANSRNWCLTFDAHLRSKDLSIAELARLLGLEELAAASSDDSV